MCAKGVAQFTWAVVMGPVSKATRIRSRTPCTAPGGGV